MPKASGPLVNTAVRRCFLGRIFSCTMSPNRTPGVGVTHYIKTQISRDFDSTVTPTHFVPITGKPQWLGVDKVTGRILGDPLANDTWTITPDSDYPKSNLAEASPSIFVRSKDNAEDFIVSWDRRDHDGEGSHWVVNGAGIVGTNFLTAKLQLSVPSWNADDFPDGEPENYVEIALSSLVATRTIASNPARNVLKLTGDELVPDQYKPGMGRVWYVHAVSSGGVFKIVGNTRNAIIVDRDPTASSTLSGNVQIFGDRFFADGTTASLDGTNVSLVTSDYKYCRHARLVVPAAGSGQAIYGSYRVIGTPVIGVHVGAHAYNGGKDQRRRFANAYGWEPTPSTLEDVGPHGVSSVTNFGTVQRWRLPYNRTKWWDRDMVMNGIADDLRQDFLFVPRGEDPNSCELVRLQSGSPNTHTAGDGFDFVHELVQVP
jgi:hypothetical protein